MSKGDIQSVNLEEWRSAQEEQARSEGWKPLDEWEGEPIEWVDAPEFNVRGSLMKRIQRQSKEIGSLKTQNQEQLKALRQLGEHNRKLAEYEYNKAIKDLRTRKKEALDVGDNESVMEIDDHLDRLKQAQSQNAAAAQQQSQQDPELDPRSQELGEDLVKWASKPENSWFQEDVLARQKFIQAGDAILREDPDIDSETLFRKAKRAAGVETKKEPAPAAFSNEPGDGTTQSKVSRSSGRKKFSARDLNEEQLQIARTLARTDALQDSEGKLTEKQQIDAYAQQLGELGELD